MQVPEDFICEHGMPQPWATCTECMMLPRDEQPIPPRPKPVPKPAPVAKKRVSASGPSRAASRAPSTRLPRHGDDTIPELVGAFDLSYEVPDENVTFHVKGPESGWLPLSSFPPALRANGWVYLQVDGDVVARARVRAIGYRDKRWSQEPSATATDIGGGPTLELRPDSWERIRVWLGRTGEQPVKGYRYLITGTDDEIRVATEDDLIAAAPT